MIAASIVDVTRRGREVVARAEEAGVPARLFGGVGVAALLGERWPQACRRVPGDLDLAAPRPGRGALSSALLNSGFAPDREFNALHGAERLSFAAGDGLKVDVVLDVLRMCHVIPLAEGFAGPGPSLPAWLLLISKLQVVELTEKDRLDAAALLSACTVEELSPASIARRCAGDWGLWRSLTGTLETVVGAPPALEAAERARLTENAHRLREALEREPKSLRWKLRAHVGERVRWYELPEAP